MLRANHVPYVSKALSRAIMKTSCFENVYFRKQDNHSLRAAYKKQKNVVVEYIKKKEKSFLTS